MFETIRYSFTEQEDALCRQFAIERRAPKVAHGVSNRKIGGQSNFDVDYLGARGELAFATLFNVPMNQLATIGGDGGHEDFVLNGLSVSVKASFINANNLLVPVHQYPPEADIFVMMREVKKNSSMLELCGWTTRDYFIDNQEVVQLVPGRNTHALSRFSLLPIHSLFAISSDSDQLRFRLYEENLDIALDVLAEEYGDVLDPDGVIDRNDRFGHIEVSILPEHADAARLRYVEHLGQRRYELRLNPST